MENEPFIWFERFSKFFLPLGPGRTLSKACSLDRAINDPDNPIDTNRGAPEDWSVASNEWDWRERAEEYDTFMFEDEGVVELAREMLKNSTMDAVNALHKSLENPRIAVQAAKEILDRAGLPATTRVNVSTIPFTADELAAAAEEVKQWEKQTKKSSG